MQDDFKTGDSVVVINSTLSGKAVIEGYALVQKHTGLSDNHYTVEFGNGDVVDRFIDPAAQDKPQSFVDALNDVQPEAPTNSPLVSFEVARVGEWKGDRCGQLNGQTEWPEGEAPDSIFWTVYGRDSEGLAVAIGDFSSESFADWMAGQIAAGRKAQNVDTGADLTGGKISPGTLAENAACLWESVLDADPFESQNPESANWKDDMRRARDRNGAAQLRGDVCRMAEAVERGFQVAQKAGFADPFDWEFCPWFIAHCVDWDPESGPSVKPDFLETCAAFGAR